MQDTGHSLKAYLQPAFLICVVVLALGSGVMSKFDIQQEPWPLKKSLELLDEQDLAAYKVVSKLRIENEDTLRELGTEDYIQWVLEDTDAPLDSSVRKCLLFITYYELADCVPHVPEECHLGTGHQLLASEEVKFTIPRSSGAQKVLGRHLVFQEVRSSFWGSGGKFSAFYLFSVNGTYANSRDDARFLLNANMLSKHSYFSKVEWNFLTSSGAKTFLSKQEATKAGGKLLGVVLPILEKEHWPDLEEADSVL